MFHSFKKVLTVIAAFAAGVSAFAQVTTSSMSGKVTDAQGPVPGAAVVAVHQPTGSQYYAITDNGGRYNLNNITAGGPYKVEISCLGYTTQIYTDINVALSDNYALNAQLAEESMSLEAVTVSAEGRTSNMRSDRAGALTSLSSKEILAVPTISRSMNDLLKQTPQAYVSGTKAYIGGGSYRDSYVTVDGAAFNNAFGIGSNLPAGGSPISLDALDQVAIAITPFDVRQSGFTGGGINATTKSGTNDVYATAYGSFRNQDFQGYKVAGEDKSSTKTDSRYLMYGASVGGPVIKDKLFFFINVEADQSVTPGPTRMLQDKVVGADGQLQYVEGGNKFTTGSDGIARPSAVVLDAVRDYMLKNYGYETGPYNGYSLNVPSLKVLTRVDWNINKNHKLNLRYSLVNSKYSSAPSTSTTGFGNSGFSSSTASSMYALYYKNVRYWQEQNHRSIAAELNSRFLDGALNNTLRATYSHQYEPRSVDGGYFPFVDICVKDDDGANRIYTTLGYEAFSYGNLRDVSTVVATDELTWNLGSHSMLLGAQFEYDNTKNGFQRMGAGAYQFDFENEQALYDATKNGTLFDNPVQFAITHGNNATFSQEFPHFDFYQTALYLQDNISVSDRFKLTAGVRFEMPIYPSLDFNRNARVEQATFLPTTNNPEGKYNTVDLPKSRVTVSPRIGFNWDILGDRQLVMRGGTGVFIGRIPFVWIVAQSGDAGVLQTTVTRQAGNGDKVPAISNDRNEMLKQLYPNGFSAEAAGLNLTSITLMDNNLTNPMSWKSSLALDAQLPGGFMASIEGVYKKDINPVTVKNIGLRAPSSRTEVPGIAARPYYGNGSYDGQISSAYLLYNVTDPSLFGHYASVTAKLEKKPWHGLSGSLSYTYSEALVLNDGVGDQVYSVWSSLVAKNGSNSPELGYASYVMPHRVVGNVTYSVDYAKFFGTTVSLSYYGGTNSRGNFCYAGSKSILGDGAYNYNLIDIPTYEDLHGADGWGSGNWGFKDNGEYTAAQQAEDCWNYIQQDKYLSKHTGEIAMRNSLVLPWTNQFDLKLNQNFYFYTGRNNHRNTLQLGVDVMNFGNMLNSNWGLGWYVNGTDGYGNANPLNLTNAKDVYVEGKKPVFQFQKNGTELLKETFSTNTSASGTWEMIFSVRYIF